MTDIETVLERVRKMHAKAESAREIGSIAEAETFASAVARMLEAHKLSMSDVELAEQDASDPMSDAFVDFEGWGLQPKSKREPWALSLATAVARAHYCRAVDFSALAGKQKIQFIGRTSDRQIAEHVFLTLYRSAIQMSKDAYKAHRTALGGSADRTYRRSWLIGFVTEIHDRYRMQASAQAGMMALVRAMDDTNDYTRKLHPFLRMSSANFNTSNATGLDEGRAAGRAANINPAKGINAWAPRTRQLTSGS